MCCVLVLKSARFKSSGPGFGGDFANSDNIVAAIEARKVFLYFAFIFCFFIFGRLILDWLIIRSRCDELRRMS